MKATVKDLWLQHPAAKFVFWVDDWYCWSRTFASPEELADPHFSAEIEFDERQPWLERCNEIWLTVSWEREPEKAAPGKTPPAG
ncbi:hypothetical protein [Succinimonas sp.]|uniref:hypothetical protein n=1 Tax=Succinimonas sp. TaxID=1936151 RepID=UPI00386DFC4E